MTLADVQNLIASAKTASVQQLPDYVSRLQSTAYWIRERCWRDRRVAMDIADECHWLAQDLQDVPGFAEADYADLVKEVKNG